MQKDFLGPRVVVAGGGGGTHLKKFFSISIKVNCRNYVFTPKLLIGSFSWMENILGINKGIFKLFNSLTKKCF